MTWPTAEDARLLHAKYAPSPEAFDLVHTHCEIVAALALQLADRCAQDLDRDLVRVGALVHDVGVYALYRPDGTIAPGTYVRHGVAGHAILRAEGWPRPLARICSCHTGVGLTRQDIERLSLPVPPGDYTARTPEERLVMYADKFHTKTRPPAFLTYRAYARDVARFGPGKEEVFARLREEFGEPDLEPLRARYPHAVRSR
ncbi:HD domain-containing protein [Streptomyces sp. NPDC017936]|uniref:HD domain-containing protein n=1 Tax=Streptomyces sp. NPDC017936 TaxID=3365016 RepID=UPI0037882B7F